MDWVEGLDPLRRRGSMGLPGMGHRMGNERQSESFPVEEIRFPSNGGSCLWKKRRGRTFSTSFIFFFWGFFRWHRWNHHDDRKEDVSKRVSIPKVQREISCTIQKRHNRRVSMHLRFFALRWRGGAFLISNPIGSGDTLWLGGHGERIVWMFSSSFQTVKSIRRIGRLFCIEYMEYIPSETQRTMLSNPSTLPSCSCHRIQ